MNPKNKFNEKYILIGIVILGLVLRIVFAIKNDIKDYQIDIGIIDYIVDDNKQVLYDKLMNFDRDYLTYGGHLEYILDIYKTHHLPNENYNQLYHPPLSHILYASFMKFESFFTNNSRILLESLEYLSIFYSIITIFVVYRILKELDFSDKQAILPISIITFHPLFIYLSRLVNTDGLLNMLSVISTLYLIKWYKKPSYKNVLILAFSIGFAAMTKTSIIIMALPLIIVYLKKLKESIDDRIIVKKILVQGIIFSLITLPMVFAYQIRNYYKFGQPLFGVVNALNELRVENNTFSARWILNKEFFSKVYGINASNVWANLIISSINFTIESRDVPYILSIILRIISVIIILLSTLSIIKFSRKEKSKDSLFILNMIYIIWIIGFIFFNISLPYSCTMHARYIVTAFIIGIIYIGILYNNLINKDLKYFISSISVLYILLSIIMFIYLISNNFECTILITDL